MRRRTGLFGRPLRRIRMIGGRRRARGSRFGALRNILPVGVFLSVLLVYTLANAPFEQKGEEKPVFSGFSEMLEELLDFHGKPGGAESDAGEFTLKDLAGLSSEKILVRLEESGQVKEVPLEEYTACVVASEMPSDFEPEALKAQAVAARTYAAARKKQFEEGTGSHYDDGAYVCDSTHCQVYRDEAGLREVKGDEWMDESFSKILSAVGATAGEVLYYDGALVEQPLFFSSGGEKTENSEDVFVSAIPYLRSVESGAYEEESPYNEVETQISLGDLKSKLSAQYGDAAQSVAADNIKILERTDGGSVAKIQLGSIELTGRQLRELCGLKSADFEVSVSGDTVTFVTSGSGHQVGLSQYGANGMAKQGKSYREILSHYYSGVEIEKLSS